MNADFMSESPRKKPGERFLLNGPAQNRIPTDAMNVRGSPYWNVPLR